MVKQPSLNTICMKTSICCLITGIAAAVLQCACGTTDKKPAAAPEKPVIENKGVKIAYKDTGKGDTTLVFVHGWAINQSYWDNQVAFFKDRYRVVTLDLPGFGESGKNRTLWTTDIYGSDIDTLLERLDIKNAFLVGHSMSGDIVLSAAIHAPGRVIGVIGVDNFKGVGVAATPTPQQKEEYAKLTEQLKQHFRETATSYFSKELFSATTADSIRKRVLNDIAQTDPVIGTTTITGSEELDEVKALTTLNKTLLLVNSDYMPTDTTGLVAHHLPYKIYNVHGSGHYPMLEQPAQFNSLLAAAITGK